MAAVLVSVPGLERLSQLANILIHQTSAGFKGNNYTVLGGGEEVLFTMNEVVPDTIFRGGSRRAFNFDGVDNTGRKILAFHHPIGRLFVEEKVELYMNGLISIIYNENTFLTPIIRIHDAQDNPTIRLKGKGTGFFELQTNTKAVIGGLQKKCRGWRDEMFSYKDDYIITFPTDLAVQFKLAVIVACVYIDFRFHDGK